MLSTRKNSRLHEITSKFEGDRARVRRFGTLRNVCLRRITLSPGRVVNTIYAIFIPLFRDRVSPERNPIHATRGRRGQEERADDPRTEVWRVSYTFHEVHFPTKLLDNVHATSFRRDRQERLHMW